MNRVTDLNLGKIVTQIKESIYVGKTEEEIGCELLYFFDKWKPKSIHLPPVITDELRAYSHHLVECVRDSVRPSMTQPETKLHIVFYIETSESLSASDERSGFVVTLKKWYPIKPL
jgi:hypothetical protein